jgi:hypothetical protein
MSGTIPPVPQCTCMALCSVKAQGQLYLYLVSLDVAHWPDDRFLVYLQTLFQVQGLYSVKRKYVLENGSGCGLFQSTITRFV